MPRVMNMHLSRSRNDPKSQRARNNTRLSAETQDDADIRRCLPVQGLEVLRLHHGLADAALNAQPRVHRVRQRA